MTTENTAKPDSVSAGVKTGQSNPVDGGLGNGSQRLPEDVPTGSRLAQLINLRNNRLEKEELMLPIPTWKGDLASVFRPMTIEERKNFTHRVQAKDYDDISVGAEFIASCCTGLRLRDENGDYQVVVLENGTEARMGPAFANSIGAKGVQTAAGCVQYLVNWNVAAIEGLVEKLHEWSRDTSSDIEGAILGE